MKPYVIAISGASHSGKTTFINGIKQLFGDQVIVYDEVIRRYADNIDEIRKNAKAYFDLQIKIIGEKIAQEEFCKETARTQNKIVIFDRSLADSLYYFMKYINVDELDDKGKEDYVYFSEIIIKKLNNHMKYVYDKVIYFNPIDPSFNTDPMRPNNILVKQNLEAHTIKSYLINSMTETNMMHKLLEINIREEKSLIDVLLKCIDSIGCNMDVDYSNFLEKYLRYSENSYTLANTITNCYGSVNTINPNLPFLFAGLCTDDKNTSDQILTWCQAIDIEDEWEDSRCYPTGLFTKGNVMIVGEAPGRKGRGLYSSYLKPSFVFTITSAILRYALYSKFSICPYITNLLKYAKPNNEVKPEDFNDNFDILLREIELLEPSIIIALGKNTGRYLQSNLPEKYRDILRCHTHPAALTYRSLTNKELTDYADKLYQLSGKDGEC